MKVRLANTKHFNGLMVLSFGVYGDGSTAIKINAEDGEPMGKATVCIEQHGYVPPEGFVVIKNFEENEGMLDALVDAGVIERPMEIKQFVSGWGGGLTDFPVCKLTDFVMRKIAQS